MRTKTRVGPSVHNFERSGITAEVVPGYFIFHRAIYPLPATPPLVSLIIVMTEPVDLRNLVSEILERTDYEPVEVIIVASQPLQLKRRTMLVNIRAIRALLG